MACQACSYPLFARDYGDECLGKFQITTLLVSNFQKYKAVLWIWIRIRRIRIVVLDPKLFPRIPIRIQI